MRSKVRSRVAALLTATAVFAGSAIMMGASPASAATVSFKIGERWADNKSRKIQVYVGGKYAGVGDWQADGDRLHVSDSLADGYGIEAHIDTGRVVTTRGHSSFYSTSKTGNLREGTKLLLWVCAVKGSYRTCSAAASVVA